jgi:hypothetical protein
MEVFPEGGAFVQFGDDIEFAVLFDNVDESQYVGVV